jgi:hypothetical protein
MIIPTLSKNQIVLLLETPDANSSGVFRSLIQTVKIAALVHKTRVFLVETHRDKIAQKTIVPEWVVQYPTVVFGSLQFCRDIKEPLVPGTYGIQNTDWNSMALNYPRDGLFNNDYRLTTWGDLYDNFDMWSTSFAKNGADLFVRPVASTKTFSGQVIDRLAYKKMMDDIDATSSVSRTTLCVVASGKSKPIEWRFWIVNREVVGEACHPYLKLWGHQPAPGYAKDLADLIALLEWQPDSCYTVDIAVRTMRGVSEAVVMELNSFSCSGVYNADMVAILSAVVDQALRDFGP